MMKHCVICWLHKNFSQHKKKIPAFAFINLKNFVSRIKSLLDVLKKQHKTHAMNWMELPANSINQLMKKSSRFFMFCEFYFACFSLKNFLLCSSTWQLEMKCDDEKLLDFFRFFFRGKNYLFFLPLLFWNFILPSHAHIWRSSVEDFLRFLFWN